MNKVFWVGSRRSQLAIAQTREVVDFIEKKHPNWDVNIKLIQTTGDRRLDVQLDKIGGKGLFIKEISKALSQNEIQLAVHSLKDMPMEEEAGLPIVGYSKREDPRDVLILPLGKREFPEDGRIGCSSFRRQIQGKRLFPKAHFLPIRGNIQTRLSKLDRGEYDALILAAAGLHRLGLQNRIFRYFSIDEMLPAAGQGVLAIQGRSRLDYSFLEGISEKHIKEIVLAERTFVRILGGGCSSPIAAYAEEQNGILTLRGLLNRGKEKYWIEEINGSREEAEALAVSLAKKLSERVNNGDHG